MSDDYAALRKIVEEAGYFTSDTPIVAVGDRIVLASKKHPYGVTGNSFWVAVRDGTWYLGTWGPHLYRLPDSHHLADLCLRWLAASEQTLPDFDADLKRAFGLVELTNDEADAVFPEEARPDEFDGDGPPVWPTLPPDVKPPWEA